MTEEQLNVLKIVYKSIDDKFGIDPVVLDISKISILADFFVIASASNPNQLSAIKENLELELSKIGIHARHVEGLASGNWVLLDFGNIIVHLFTKDDRDYYNLERIWADAELIDLALLR